MISTFTNWLKNAFSKISSFLIWIKSRTIESISIQNNQATFTFPEIIEEKLDVLQPSLRAEAGFLFESECYLALKAKGLQDKTINFNETLYNQQKETLTDIYNTIKEHANILAEQMISNAQKLLPAPIIAVQYKGGRTITKAGQFSRADAADIILLCAPETKKTLGYSIKYYKQQPSKLLLSNISVSSLMQILGQDKDTWDELRIQRLQTRMPKVKISKMIYDVFKNYKTPEKFTDLLNYLITGYGYTSLAIFTKDNAEAIFSDQIFEKDFQINNTIIYPKAPAKVSLSRTKQTIFLEYKTDNNTYTLIFYPNVPKWTVDVSLRY